MNAVLAETLTIDFYQQKWQALGDTVSVRVDFRGKSVKLIDVRRPSADDLAYCASNIAPESHPLYNAL